MADVIYNIAKKSFADGNLDWDTHNIGVLLLSSSSTYTPNPDHNYVRDIFDNGGVELSGTGYSRKLLTNKTVTKDDSIDKAILDADDVTWTAINAGTVKAAVLYRRVGSSDNNSSDILIAYIDSGGFPVTTNGGDFTIQWNANGIIQIG